MIKIIVLLFSILITCGGYKSIENYGVKTATIIRMVYMLIISMISNSIYLAMML